MVLSRSTQVAEASERASDRETAWNDVTRPRETDFQGENVSRARFFRGSLALDRTDIGEATIPKPCTCYECLVLSETVSIVNQARRSHLPE